jgi:putative hydrolase of the HAD superfamily
VSVAALVFDFDGTILDTEHAEYVTTKAVWAAHGLDLTVEMWTPLIGTPNYDWVEHLESTLGESIDVARANILREATHHDAIDGLAPRDGVIQLLDSAAQRGIPCAVGSNAPAWWPAKHLARLDLRDRFEAIVSFEHVPNAKPAPDVFLQACSLLQVDPTAAVVFEDSHVGVTAGVAAGCYTVACTHPLSHHHDVAAAHWRVESWSAVSLPELDRRLGELAAGQATPLPTAGD